MLTHLSEEQTDLFPVIRDKWLDIGLATGPVDRELAESLIPDVYRAGGLEPPANIVWLDSPFAGLFFLSVLGSLDQVWDQIKDQIRDQVRKRVKDKLQKQVVIPVRDQVRDKLRKQLRRQVVERVWDQVWNEVCSQAREQIREQIIDQIWIQVDEQVWEQVNSHMFDQVQVSKIISFCCYGQHDSFWLSFYDYMSRVGVEGLEVLQPLAKLSSNVGWWWPFKDLVVLTERPSLLQRDSEYRLHSEDGPAISYPDGWGIWAHHGVRVTQHVIEDPDSLGVDEITNEPNAEVRRVMLERYGSDRYISKSDARLVHMDDWGKLWGIEFNDDESLVMVEVINSTPESDGSFKNYWLRVPSTCHTAREAVAWSFGLGEDEYHPVLET